MSCGLCGLLERRLGRPPFLRQAPSPSGQTDAELYGNNWDMHPFGAWLANDVAIHGRDLEKTVRNINVFRATNGEEIHGFAWQSLRLLAYDDDEWLHHFQYDKMIKGDYPRFKLDWIAPKHAMRLCFQMWAYSPQSRDDCAHGVGHGML